ncbi:UNC93-like protein isoform X3 [Schistocerca gregaria]|uniref:UNC93-like protein isoform X3 n=1 Tax=Schistocerca gregaria TaxID=7010 RepID=UPI00211E4A48|nr:UNC93-like protein isoform X3 [Schistocerca gregaria]
MVAVNEKPAAAPPAVPASCERRRISRNVVLLSLAFMLHFTAFQGAGNLQSSVNADAGLGTASLATIYASLIVSNIFLPVVVIKWLGCKWAVAASFVAYMPYIAAQFHATFYTMIPAALFVGFGGGPLWCAKCTYLSVVAEAYEEADPSSGPAADVLTVRFFGIFFMIFQFCQVWGNLISSTVFSLGSGAPKNLTGDLGDVCGANYLPSAASGGTAASRPPDEKIYIVAAAYLACMVSACLLVGIGVDSLSRYKEGQRQGSGTGLSGFGLLAITLKLLKERDQLLMLPIIIFLGFEQAFIGADFTASYVTCAWGVQNIGYVMMCYGACNSLSALTTGWLVKVTGRPPVVLGAAAVHVALLAGLLLWQPLPHHLPLFFAMAGLWGACDGVWNVQVNALCGILFPGQEKVAFSSFRLWESLGYILAYGYSAYLRTDVKLFVVLGLLLWGMAGYVAIEVGRHRRKVRARLRASPGALTRTKL